MGSRKLDCFDAQVSFRLSASCWPEQDAVQWRAQFMRHVRQELRFVFGGQRQFRGPFPSRAPRPVRFPGYFALYFDIAFSELLRPSEPVPRWFAVTLSAVSAVHRPVAATAAAALRLHRRSCCDTAIIGTRSLNEILPSSAGRVPEDGL